MRPASISALGTTAMVCLLLVGGSTLAQANPTWVDPPTDLGDVSGPELSKPEPAAALGSTGTVAQEAPKNDKSVLRAQEAQAFAVDYLNLWSAPNQLTLAATSSFYGPTVRFHGQERTLGSVLAEKRRFTKRWPQRSYRYRPETTMVACESTGGLCTVWAIFDFSAANPAKGKDSLGIGEHELVMGLSNGRPVIVSETSRVLYRGALKHNLQAALATERR
jgi:hypothetical protein